MCIYQAVLLVIIEGAIKLVAQKREEARQDIVFCLIAGPFI